MKVSILIPARNEEMALPRLIDSLEKLTFPNSEFEILFGNDGSTDATQPILEAFSAKNPHVKILTIDQTAALKGKTRALNILAKAAKGEYLFFTDADISLPPNWITGMLDAFSAKPNVGVVIGLTILKPKSLWAAMQSLEWLVALTNFKILDQKNIATTGMGNNMAVTSEAYHAVGGYENIPFSIIEDYALYKAIINKGLGHFQAFSADVLAYTLPPTNYFEQRKRWISGAVQSRSKLIWIGVLRSFLFPFLIFLLFFNPAIALIIMCAELIINLYLTRKFEKSTETKGFLKWVPLFTIWGPLVLFLQFVFYFLPGKVVWKGRKYQ